MAAQLHSVEWVVECVLRKAGDPKMRLAMDGTFTSQPELVKRFDRYVDADRARRGMRTPTHITEF